MKQYYIWLYSGRINRKQFFQGQLLLGVVLLVINIAGMISITILPVPDHVVTYLYFMIGSIVVYGLFQSSLTIRRLHDCGQSWWAGRIAYISQAKKREINLVILH